MLNNKTINHQFVFIIFFSIIGAPIFSSCEKEITLDIPQPEAKLVVEGYIENGLPPFVTLSSTVPFYGNINFNELDNFYVHDAEVIVSDGITSVTLTEYCLNDLPAELIPFVAEYLGISLDSLGGFPVDICMYTDAGIFTGTPTLIGEPGKTYSLDIHALDKSYSAITQIPQLSFLDSVYVKKIDDPEADSLYRLYITLSDPDTLGNYYRYFTNQNGNGFYTGFSSVADDLFINGITFDFTLDRGIAPTEDYDPDTYGYFFSGDTIILKWTTIDKQSYDFFSTLEFDSGTDGPFSSATIVKTNISEDGLGIWCGYGATYDTLYVED